MGLKEKKKMGRKMLSVLLILAMIGGPAMSVYSQDAGENGQDVLREQWQKKRKVLNMRENLAAVLMRLQKSSA